ncbi:MAG TPA: DUF6746 family protein [Porticoccaceae bacterium]
MKKLVQCAVLTFTAVGFTGAVLASDDRPDHFKGVPSETLEAAVGNFSEYNKKLAEILAKDELTPEDMVHVHELTYTLENALEKLEDEIDDLADVLEEVHEASERLDAATVKQQGDRYLDTAGKIIP